MSIFAKVFGTKNDREIKRLQPRVQAINALEDKIKALSDEALAARIGELKGQVTGAVDALVAKKGGEDKVTKDDVNGVLDPHLHETFAIVREAGRRVLGMRHYDVQLIGGMVLHEGKISEMKTGEGKTLVATLPAVFNALTSRGVHVVTVNDYLATRDAEWMGRIYRFLGMQVGVVVPHQGDRIKKEAYRSDITYGQNNEFGFDYLRDNMKFALKDYAQRGHGFAIVDEVDSILIDEARTPLIISGPSDEDTESYLRANAIIPKLRKDEDFTIDEKARQVLLTETGVTKCEQLVGVENLYEPVNIDKLHRLTQALRAHTLYKRDVDYVVEKGDVVIVDEHTGRLMYGRRWSDGLHGAVEAKEGVKVQAETQTLATISFQNYFRMYRKLSGMTGTADTEAEEFAKIYNLDVILIPTNRKVSRIDEQDLIYKTEGEKVDAIVDDIKTANAKGQPVLVGTVSVEKSEVLANRLKKLGIDHQVLNAKRHKDEATIVAQAGHLGAVTIATNMAGRGTDILLGGNAEYLARQEVAKQIGESKEQVAEFAFLTGRADLINIEKLAERDAKDVKFTSVWEVRIAEDKEKAEAAAAAGETYESPADLPKSMDEIRARIKADRIDFYRKSVALYAEVLPRFEAQCAADKEKVKAAGGLRIVGTERHESRRIDNQLRGRAGRQGDPGSSRFYMSLQDDLMRIFGSDKMIRVMEMLGMEDGVPIEHKMVTSSIANAQKRVEGMHFDSRKNLIEYDDVMNQQRKAVYSLRRRVLDGKDLREMIFDLVEEAVVQSVQINCPDKTSPNEWKVAVIADEMKALTGVSVDLVGLNDRDDIMDKCFAELERFYLAKEQQVGPDALRQLESYLYLQTIDAQWKAHLHQMDHLREGIHLRGYGQKDPKQEYKKEGFRMFAATMGRIRDEVLEKVFKAQLVRQNTEEELARLKKQREQQAAALAKRMQAVLPGGASAPASSSAMPLPTAGASSATGMRPPTFGASGATTSPPRPGATPPMPATRKAPVAAAGADGDDDDDPRYAGLNREQRRKLKAKDRKAGKRPGL